MEQAAVYLCTGASGLKGQLAVLVLCIVLAAGEVEAVSMCLKESAVGRD